MKTQVLTEEEPHGPDELGPLGEMFDSNPEGLRVVHDITTSEALTRDFCERVAVKSSGFLVAYAAEVVLFTKMTSLRKVANYFSERFGRKVTEMPIRDILTKVRSQKIKVTPEQIMRVAEAHPVAKRFLQTAPWAADTTTKVTEPVVSEAPAKRKRGRPSSKKAEAVADSPSPESPEARGFLFGIPVPAEGGNVLEDQGEDLNPDLRNSLASLDRITQRNER